MVTLSNGDDTEIGILASVTIPADEASVTFDIDAVDDDLVDGQSTATITASTAGYQAGTNSVLVTDDDVPTLTVTITPSETLESTTATGTVTRNANLSGAMTVVLQSDDPSEATVRAFFVVPANELSADFPVTTINDGDLDGTQVVTITATAFGYVDGEGLLDVLDAGLNLPPAIDPVPDQTVDAGMQTLTLTGIRTRRGVPQPIRVSAATGSDLFSDVSVDYDSPGDTAALSFTAGLLPSTNFGSITVTVEDGGPDADLTTLDDNGVTLETFSVDVQGEVMIDLADVSTGGDVTLHRNGSRLELTAGSTTISQLSMDAMTSLTILGTDSDDRLIIDNDSGMALPSLLTFSGRGQSSAVGDSLVIGETAVSGVEHRFADSSSGAVLIDGHMIHYDGLEPIVDNLDAGDRVFTFAGVGVNATLRDEDSESTGELRLESDGSETVTFANPTSSLTINATAGDDIITVQVLDTLFVAALSISGDDGHDLLHAEAAGVPVTLRGGMGNDSLRGGVKGDVLIGSDGNDRLLGRGGPDLLDGGAGDDDLNGGGATRDSLTGGPGVDVLNGGSGTDLLLETGLGDATLTPGNLESGGESDTLLRVERAHLSADDAGRKIDTSAFAGGVTLFGGAGADHLIGTFDNDILFGFGGNDEIEGGPGNDYLLGSAGRDRLFGQEGNDSLRGQGSSGDVLDGGPGNDFLDGGAGTDLIVHVADADIVLENTRLTAGAETDTLRRVERADLTVGDGGHTIDASEFGGGVTLRGGAGADRLIGTFDNDILFGFGGNDTIIAGDGNDYLFGAAGRDRLLGEAGNDFMKGQGGSGDVLNGGQGADTLQALGGGKDRIEKDDDDSFTSDPADVIVDVMQMLMDV